MNTLSINQETSPTLQAPSGLASFQQQIGAYLRDPNLARPESLPPRPAEIYSELVFNNLCSFVNACFPVCRTLLPQSHWDTLSRQFFRDWYSHSPLFHEIPGEFLGYLEAHQQALSEHLDLPPWLLELAHYEWVELAVDTRCDQECPGFLDSVSDDSPSEKRLHLNATLFNLSYQWPVHKITADWQPDSPEPTYLAVYRDNAGEVRFAELNPMTSALLSYIDTQSARLCDLFHGFASSIGHPSPEALKLHGEPLVAEFIEQGILRLSASTDFFEKTQTGN